MTFLYIILGIAIAVGLYCIGKTLLHLEDDDRDDYDERWWL